MSNPKWIAGTRVKIIPPDPNADPDDFVVILPEMLKLVGQNATIVENDNNNPFVKVDIVPAFMRTGKCYMPDHMLEVINEEQPE